jgi:hypothetical protein
MKERLHSFTASLLCDLGHMGHVPWTSWVAGGLICMSYGLSIFYL